MSLLLLAGAVSRLLGGSSRDRWIRDWESLS